MPITSSLRIYRVVDDPPEALYLEFVEEISNLSPTDLWRMGEDLTVYASDGKSQHYIIDMVIRPVLRGANHIVHRISPTPSARCLLASPGIARVICMVEFMEAERMVDASFHMVGGQIVRARCSPAGAPGQGPVSLRHLYAEWRGAATPQVSFRCMDGSV